MTSTQNAPIRCIDIRCIDIRCITFDLDDTLWDCMPIILEAENIFYQWLGQHFPQITQSYTGKELIDHRQSFMSHHPEWHFNLTHLRKLWLKSLADEFKLAHDWIEEGFHIFWHERNNVTLYDGARPMLENLNSQFTLGSITDGNADISRCGLDDVFHFSVRAEEAGASKPSPTIFEYAMEKAELSDPKQIIHIGDHADRDILGALKMNMHAIWFNSKHNEWPYQHYQPTAIVHSIDDIENAVKMIANKHHLSHS